MQRLDEVQRYAPAFLRAEVELDAASVAKVFTKAGAAEAIEAAQRVLADVEWTLEAIEAALRALPEELGIGFGKVAQPIRVAVTGVSVSPPLFESIELLGRELTLARLDAALPVARGPRRRADPSSAPARVSARCGGSLSAVDGAPAFARGSEDPYHPAASCRLPSGAGTSSPDRGWCNR